MRKLYSLVWMVLSLLPILGIAQNYQTPNFVSGQGNPGGVTVSDTESSGWTTAYSGAQTSNSYSDVIPIPFSFKFFGNTVTHLKAAPNGFLTFDTTATALPDTDVALPTATLPDQSIAAFWDDFQPTASGDIIRYKTFSTSTGNQFWIKWHSMTVGTASFAYFAVVLEEGSNNIYIVDMYSSAATADARIGLQDDINTSVIADNNATLANNSSAASNNEYWEFNPIVNGVDVRVLEVELSDLALNGCGGNMETITVSVTNGGSQSASGLLGTFSLNGAVPTFFENIPGTLNPGDTLSYTFQATADLSAIGSNALTGIVSAVGDVCLENDSLTQGVITEAGLTVPIPTVDFTGYTSSNLPTIAPGWFEADGFGVPDSGSSLWVQDDYLNDVNHPNGKAARINLFTDNREEWIVSPKVLLGTQSFLRFDLALTAFSTGAASNFGSDDYLEVLISNDCGLSYTPLVRYDSTSGVSNLGQTEIVSLSAFAGQEVSIGFFATDGAFEDDEDYNVYVDNIQVANPAQVEVSPTGLAVNSSFCFGTMETVEASIQNLNPTPLDFSTDSVIWVLEIDGPIMGSFTDTITMGTLASGAFLPLTLTNMADFSLPGTYDLTFYTSNPDDGDNSNDTTTLAVEVNNQIAPYFENFDGFTVSTGFNGGWERSNTSGFRWLIDNNATGTSNTGPGQDHTSGSGNYVFTEASSGSQGDSTFLVSPCIDLSAIGSPTMSFWYHMYGEDMGTLEALIFTSTDTTSVFSISGEQDLSEAPGDPWNNVEVDITAFAGQTIKVAFLGIRGPDIEGDMGVDDLFIFEATGKDILALEATVPTSECFFDMDSVVSYRLVNLENQLDLTMDTLFVTVTVQGPGGAQVVTDTIASGTLATGDTLDSDLILDFTPVGVYEVTLSVSLEGDQNPFNNELVDLPEVKSVPIYAMPYTEDFDAFTPSTGTLDPGVIGDDWRRDRTVPHAWYPNDGTTPSTNTGPDDDNAGGGNYMYTEASDPADVGDVAIFTTPCIDLSTSTTPALEFFYHLYGEDMGSLEVLARNRAGVSQTVFFIQGEQQTDNSDPFVRVLANLGAFVGDTIEIDFISTYGSDFDGDMAIDDVSVIEPTGKSVSLNAVVGFNECLGSDDSLKVSIENFGGPLDLNM
ncbi:MAG: choice-of-anchor J domain-containing protein, partial [Bacteroidota bacterium]